MFDWFALGKIIWIDILLSGDNALVIAMACRGLAPNQRKWGMLLGAGAAILMRVIFTGVASQLMEQPYLKIVGGLALFYVAIKLLLSNDDDETEVATTNKLFAAVRIVVVADVVMSLDNVIAIAAASNGSLLLLCIGLAISIPLIVSGASIIVTMLNKYPALIWAGAALLGWISGEVLATDAALRPYIRYIDVHTLELLCGSAGVILVLWFGAIHRWTKASAEG